jgi:hypothetical protein
MIPDHHMHTHIEQHHQYEKSSNGLDTTKEKRYAKWLMMPAAD